MWVVRQSLYNSTARGPDARLQITIGVEAFTKCILVARSHQFGKSLLAIPFGGGGGEEEEEEYGVRVIYHIKY